MFKLLFWLYLVHSILLILHEMDSAFWQEWKLFRLPGGITFFLLLHVPLLFLLQLGLFLLWERTLPGLILSLLFGLGGAFAFFIHTHFIRKGRDEFKTPASLTLLMALLLTSLPQIFLSLYLLSRHQGR